MNIWVKRLLLKAKRINKIILTAYLDKQTRVYLECAFILLILLLITFYYYN